MNILKRAFISITRNLGKTLILLLITLILGTAISGAISVRQAVGQTQKSIRDSLPAVANIVARPSEEMSNNPNFDWQSMNLTPDMLREVSELPYVRSFDYNIRNIVYSETLVRTKLKDNDSSFENNISEEFQNFDIRGIQNHEMLDIEEGIIELTAGRSISESEIKEGNAVAMVSQDFASANHLTVGSIVEPKNIVWDWTKMGGGMMTKEHIGDTEAVRLEIVGIFNPTAQTKTGEAWTVENLLNRIYVPNQIVERQIQFLDRRARELYPEQMEGETGGENESPIWYENVFTMNNPDDLEAFRAAVAKILPEYFSVNDMSNSFGEISSSMRTMERLSDIVLYVSVGATLLILSLLITLFLRDRKKEIGIFIALGESRTKVVGQMIVEVLVISLVALTVSLFVGNLLSNNLSENMLRESLAANAEQMNSGMMEWNPLTELGFTANASNDDLLASYDVSLSARTVLLYLVVGIGSVLISTIAPIVYIVRLKPKKIMM